MGVDLQAAAEVVTADRRDDLTTEWRALQFARLGFENADQMARSNVDWHEAAALPAAGATPNHIARILL
jgi:hypothetical protein